MVCQSEKNERSLLKECFWMTTGAVTIAWIFWRLWKWIMAADLWLNRDANNFILF